MFFNFFKLFNLFKPRASHGAAVKLYLGDLLVMGSNPPGDGIKLSLNNFKLS